MKALRLGNPYTCPHATKKQHKDKKLYGKIKSIKYHITEIT